MHLNSISFHKASLMMFCDFQGTPGNSTVSSDFNTETESIHLFDCLPKASISVTESQQAPKSPGKLFSYAAQGVI